MGSLYSTTKILFQEEPTPSDNIIYFYPEQGQRKGEGGLRTQGYFKKSITNKPLISIITVVYNGEKYLEQTIQSLLNQTYDNVEYIIIDGGSKDKTLEIIKKYENKIDYWISEKDNGIYDAMNKGIKCASGELIAFLNADDWYELDTLSKVSKIYNDDNSLDMIFGTENKIDKDGNIILIARIKMSEFKRHMPLAHPALFVKTQLHKKHLFDIRFKIAADYDFVLTILKLNPKYYYIDEPLTNFRKIGISATSNLSKENFKVLSKHFGMTHALLALSANFLLSNSWKFLYFILGSKNTDHFKKLLKKLLLK